MADGSVQFLLESVKQVFLYYHNRIADADTQIELLENDLRLFIVFLRESNRQNRNKDALNYVVVREIRDIVYEIEELIEAKSIGKEKWHCLPVKLINVAEKINTINKKVNHALGGDRNRLITGELFAPAYQTEEVKHKKIWKMREDKIVGFEEETKTIIRYLRDETEQLDVISIIGQPGLGKTTLAHKIFHHPHVQSHFPIRIWVNVSINFTKKSVYLSILSKFRKITDDINKLTEEEIAESIRDYLKESRFLVVMDDVWTAQAWIDLEDVFLLLTSNSSKVLITSRNEEVSQQANRNRKAFKPPLLTFDESWLLLQLEVCGKPSCPQDLEDFGKDIARQCRGLPLAIAVIGGILVKKSLSEDMISKRNLWHRVSQSVTTYLNDDPESRMQDIISLSYIELPYYLRPCFLYLGMFPEDYAIPIKNLIWMWMAEGLIMKKKDIAMEEIARDYLEELISRNLAMVDTIGLDGNIKTCRLHDTIRQFCIIESGSERENFFQEMKLDTSSSIKLADCRRLTILANNKCTTIPQFYVHCVRSLLIFGERVFDYRYKISKAFKLLRTLDAAPIIFSSFPKEYGKLFHLRYLVLTGEEKFEIPKAIGKLQNLQTLIVDTFYCDIKANIWEMVQLRHVKVLYISSIRLPKKINDGKIGGQLQSLGGIDAKYCTEVVFDRIYTSLKKLRIRADEVGTLLKIKAFHKLEKLEKLSIWYLVSKLPRLPEPLPPKLRRLSLWHTRLEWGYMSKLGMLDTLELLKLQYEAFVGPKWVTTAGGFSRLEVLYIYDSWLAIWEAEADHFPRLKHLVLKWCRQLEEIPQGLGENLDKLELIGGRKCLSDAARRIEAAKNSSSSSTIIKFHLSIDKEIDD